MWVFYRNNVFILCTFISVLHKMCVELILVHYRRQKWFPILSGDYRLIVMMYKFVVVMISSLWAVVLLTYFCENWKYGRKDDVYMSAMIIFMYLISVLNVCSKTNDVIENEYRKNRRLRIERYMLQR